MGHPPLQEVVELVRKLKPTLIKSLGDGSYMAALHEALYPEFPDMVFIWRVWWDSPAIGTPDSFTLTEKNATSYPPPNYAAYFNPLEAYQMVRDAIGVPELNKVRFKPNVYLQLFCEVGSSINYWTFERERSVQLWYEFGIGSIAGNNCPGCSDAGQFDQMHEVGMQFTSHEVPTIYGEDSYAPLSLKYGHGDFQKPFTKTLQEYVAGDLVYPANMMGTWYAFRIMRSRQEMIRIGMGDIYAAIGEFGYDNIEPAWYKQYPPAEDARGWKDWREYWILNYLLNGGTPNDFVAHEMDYANRQLAVLPFVVGACWFTYGHNEQTGEWDSFDTRGSGIWEAYAELLYSEPGDPTPPAPSKGCSLFSPLQKVGEWIMRAYGVRIE